MKNAVLPRHVFAGFALGTATIALVACPAANDLVGPRPTETTTSSPPTSTPLRPVSPTPTGVPKATATATPPPTGTPSAMVEVGGAWSGTFATSDPRDCVPAVAALAIRVTQNGASFQAALPTLPCGFGGLLQGRIGAADAAHGETAISGTVAQTGASGGVWTGWIDSPGVHVAVRDLLRPMPDGSIEVHPGGRLELHR